MSQITIAGWARKHGFSRQYAHRLVQSGVIPRGADGQLDEGEANAALAASREPTRPQRRQAADHESSASTSPLHQLWLKTRIKNEITRGEILQLEMKAKKRERVPLDEVHTLLARIASVTRDHLLNLPDRIQHALVAQADAAGMHRVLSDALREALITVSEESIEALKQELAHRSSTEGAGG